MTLAGRAFRSGAIVTASSLGLKLVNLAGLVILARLLVPQDFGVVALALVVVTTGSLLAQVGMGSALIASRADTRVAAFHVAILNLMLGSALFVAAASLAGPLASLLGAPGFGSVFRWMCLVLLFETLAVVPDALLMKELRFGRRAGADGAGVAVQLGVAVVGAVAGLGVWSLVLGHVGGAATRLLCVTALAPRIGWFRLRPWDADLARHLLKFGGTAMGTTLTRHLYNNADNVVVGRLFGTGALGFYSQAYNLTNLPVQSVSQVTNAVLLPVYTRVRDVDRLARGFVAAFRLVAAVTVPLSVALFLLAPEAVLVLLGDQWSGSIVLLQVLAGMALVRPLSGTTSPLFLAVERPGLNLITAVVQALFMVPLLILLAPFGPTGVAIAVVATFTFGLGFNIWQVTRRTTVPIRLRAVGRACAPIVTAGALMGAAIHGTRLALDGSGVDRATPGALAVLVLVGAVAYVAAIAVLDRRLVTEVARLIREGTHTP